MSWTIVEKKRPPKIATVIIVTGPIGCGKSTEAERLCKENPNLQHIDGDKIFGNKTLYLGKERASATLTALLRVVTSGKTPVLSCGGGVLFGGSKHFFLKDFLKKTIDIKTELIVVSKKDVDNWDVADAISSRIESGEWIAPEKHTKDSFIKDIQRKSDRNKRFWTALEKAADKKFSFDCPRFKTKTLTAKKVSINQLRRLAIVPEQDNVFHVTLEYCREPKTIELQDDTEEQINGMMLETKSGCKVIALENGQHVTIDSNGRTPVEMGSFVKKWFERTLDDLVSVDPTRVNIDKYTILRF